jgi:competence protein ComEC
LNRSLFAFREKLSNAIKNNLPKEEGELICAMMVGEKGTGLNVVKELFRLAGMLALLTISGTHISVIANSVKDLLRKMGFSFITCAYASSVVSLLYTIMCGSGVSAKRAFLCFILSMIGLVFGEAYDSLNGLSVVGFILLIDKPYLCMNSSFVLSFGIMFGVVGVSIPAKKQIIERLRNNWKKRYHQTKKEKFRLKAWERLYIYFISVLLIQLFAIPIVSYFFYEIPTYSCFVNMMLLPLFPVMLGLSLMGGVLLCIGEKVLSFIFIYIVHLLIYFYEYVADISTKLPFSRVIVGKPSWLVLLIYYVVLIVLFADFFRFKRIHKAFGVLCIMFLLLLPKQNKFAVNMLYVGQGDGIHIHLSRSVDLFVDGGSTSEQEVGKYTIIPYLKSKGIRDIDMWMVTHPDLDHISGLIELLEEGYEIKEIVTSKEVYDSDAFSEVLNKASQNGTKIHLVSDGTIMEFDAGSISFFWPKSGFSSDDMNDLSLGFVLKHKGFSATFTGDMSGEIEKENLNKVKECTLFKSSHHGSNMSNSKEFLEVLRPEVIIISAGEKNRYGHPGKNALDRMRIYTPNIYCTKWNGQITVFGDGNVKTLLDKPI